MSYVGKATGRMSEGQKKDYMFALATAVKDVGMELISCKRPVSDISVVRGHEESTVDIFARERMIAALDKYLPDFSGELRFEHSPFTISRSRRKRSRMKLYIDEIDGTTNFKRWLGAKQEGNRDTGNYRPKSAVSVALCEGNSLRSAVVGAIYAIDEESVYTAMKLEDDFQALRDDRLLKESMFATSKIADSKVDTANRVLVVGYSNKNRAGKGMIEQALVDGKRYGRVYDGCRASTIDILDIARGAYDAYVDTRACWANSGAVLQDYDVGAVVLVARGLGFGVKMKMQKTPGELHLIVARTPQMADEIESTIKEPLRQSIEQWESGFRLATKPANAAVV